MKKLLLFVFAGLFLFSCQLKEEITFYEDGSGYYTESVDLSFMSSFLKSKRTSSPKLIDTLFKVDQLLQIESFKKQLAPDEFEVLTKYLSGYTYELKMDTAEPSFMRLTKSFKEINDEMGFSSMSTLSNKVSKDKLVKLSKEWKKGTNQKLPINSKTNLESKIPTIYSYNNSVFTRTIDTTFLTDSIAEILSGDKMSNQFFKDSGYVLVYHFPKPIKTVNQANYSLSEDKKTITFYRNQNDKYTKPYLFCFRIELED